MIPIITFNELKNDKRFVSIFSRELTFDPAIERTVLDIIRDVRNHGDKAVLDYTSRFDGVELDSLEQVPMTTLKRLHARVDNDFLDALKRAVENVRSFHRYQYRESVSIKKKNGVTLGLRYTPLSSIGLYVPGGAAAYPSSIVMNAVPAQIAGVERIVVVTPPGRFRDNPHIAATLVELGLFEVYTIGGAQAIAALAYGTETIPRVDKIVGPGNIFVAIAKKLVFGQVAIDMIAGPSELVVVADETAEPRFVAADLLSQAEHGSGKEMVLLVTTSRDIASQVQQELYHQIETLPRSEDMKKVLEANALVIVDNLGEAVDVVNQIAPEHLELIVNNPRSLLDTVKHAGAIFLGPYSPEPVGDYYAGPNHVLPTSGTARFSSPLGVYDFQKCSSVIEYSNKAIDKYAGDIDILAGAEGFKAHARSVTIRNEKHEK